MKTINVAKSFSLILKSGQPPVTIPAGVQSVEDNVADHWYTKLHLADGGFGTAEYAAGTRARADAAFVKANAAAKEYVGLEKAAQEAEKAAGLEPVDPAHVRLGDLDDDREEGPGPDAPKANAADAKGGEGKPRRGRAPKAPPAGGNEGGAEDGAGQSGKTGDEPGTDAKGGEEGSPEEQNPPAADDKPAAAEGQPSA